MSSINLRPVTKINQKECLSISLRNDQKHFVPDVASSLDIAKKYPNSHAVAVYNEEGKIIGFALYGIEERSDFWKIFRLLIDFTEQNKGYGSAATRELIKVLKNEHNASSILISYQDDNQAARVLYSKFGFKEFKNKGQKITAILKV